MNQKHPDDFTTFQTKKILKLKRDRLKDWIMRGYIIPTRQEEIKIGMKSYFDRWGLYMIKLFHHLVSNGVAREQAAEWIRELAKYKDEQIKPDPLIADFLMIKRKGSKVVDKTIHWGPSGVIHPGEDLDDAYIVNFLKIREAVDSAIEEIGE